MPRAIDPQGLRRRLLDAGAAALVALILAVPLVGLQAVDNPAGLQIATR